MNNLKNNTILLAFVLVAIGVFPLLSSSSLTTNPEAMIESYVDIDNNAKNDDVNSLDKSDKPISCVDSFCHKVKEDQYPKNF